MIEKEINNEIGYIPKVSTAWTVKDYAGTFLKRLSIGRMHYSVEPGIYAVNQPTAESPVFVSANYKMSFDYLRHALTDIDAWILVLDTKGINVWCAAGKGTFGTKELVNRIEKSRLGSMVKHKKIIVPQLGAPGVEAHKIKEQTGFSVVYGPVRARDIPKFIKNNYRADKDMRRVTFSFWDRLVLIPVELSVALKNILLVSAIIMAIAAVVGYFTQIDQALTKGLTLVTAVFLGLFCGAVVTPLLLPFLPNRAFALKGFWAGLIGFLFWWWGAGINSLSIVIENLANGLVVTGISSFLAMNFTGASTYTSLSGVIKEMKLAVPIQKTGLGIAGLLWIINLWL